MSNHLLHYDLLRSLQLSSANLSLHDKMHQNEKRFSHTSMEFLTDSR